MESNRGLGMYLDAGTVRGILREGGAEQMASWLGSIDSVLMETDLRGRPDRSRVVIWLSDTDRGDGGLE